MRTLISCIGSANYKQCQYVMADGVEVTSGLFSAALIQREQQKKKPIERIIFLGTTDSGWNVTLIELMKDALLNHPFALAHEEAISAAISNNAVTSENLKVASDLIAETLGISVELALVPRALNPEEQEIFTETVLGLLKSASTLHVDVTHGYRHWPFLLSQIAFLAEQTTGLCVERFSYGFFDSEDAKGKEVLLDTFVKVSERTAAASFFRDTWDARSIRKMMPADKRISIFNSRLNDFTHMLSINNLSKARESAHQILSFFDADPLTCQKLLFPYFDLIKATLGKVSNGGSEENWERDKVFFEGLVEHGDFFRGIMFLWESWISRVLENLLKHNFNLSGDNFSKAMHNLKVRQCMTIWAVHKDGFYLNEDARKASRFLNRLRNFVAHGGLIRDHLDQRLKKVLSESSDLLIELRAIERALMGSEVKFNFSNSRDDFERVMLEEGLQL